MKLQFCVIVLLAFLGPLLVPVSCAPFSADPDVTIEKIFQVWKKRQEQVRSARFEWTESVTYIKETLDYRPLPPKRAGDVPPLMPREDVTVQIRATLTFDGERIRSDRDGPTWKEQRGEFVPTNYAVVFDGKESYTLFGSSGGGLYPVGFVDAQKHDWSISSYERPVLNAYRPFHSAVGECRQQQDWLLTDQRGVVEGRTHVILEKSPQSNNPFQFRESLWLDAERDYSIGRYVFTIKGALAHQTDISYRRDASFGWVPSEWRDAWFNENKSQLRRSSTARVSKYEINVPIPQELFRPPFPAGTEVQDRATKTEYIVRDGGRKRLITKEERQRGAGYEDLVNTESGMARLSSSAAWWRSWWLWLTLLSAIAILGWLLWKKTSASRINA